MKIGTFVGCNTLDLSNEEVENLRSRFEQALALHFPESKPTITVERDNKLIGFNHVLIRAKGVMDNQPYRVMCKGDDWFIRRKDCIQPTGEITILFYKQNGYNEAVTGPFYEWEAGYQPKLDIESYSAAMSWHGKHRTYRRRYTDGLEIKDSSTYGTELKDLEIEDYIRRVAEVHHYPGNVKISKLDSYSC